MFALTETRCLLGACVALFCGVVWQGDPTLRAESPEASATATATESPTLAQLCAGELRILDLTYTLNDKTVSWPGENYQPFQLKTIATLDKDGVLSKAFCMPEHLGTHLDAPNHFEKGQPAVDRIPPGELFAAGVMLDLSPAGEADPDYLLSVADILEWERTHGRIPDSAVVFLNTGWGRHWDNAARYKNQDMMGRMHFPGYSKAAAEFLVKDRKARGVGIDTLSIDRGMSRDFPVHHVVNQATRYGLENVARLDQLPPRGFYVVVAPIKIETGTGGPTRIFAILPGHRQ